MGTITWLMLLGLVVCVVAQRNVISPMPLATQAGSSDNTVDVVNATTLPQMQTTEGRRLFMIRERLHSRNRRFRIQVVRETILQRLGWSEVPRVNLSAPEVLRRLENYNISREPEEEDEEDQEDERRCFSGSCLLPRNVDTTLWGSPAIRGFRVFTNVSTWRGMSRARLHNAYLNVFLRNTHGVACNGRAGQSSDGSSSLLVSVYQFLRPLRFQRSRRRRILNRKRLIAFRMLTTNDNMWITFEVRPAVQEWMNGQRNNFGFEIIVKDENHTECDTANMFVPVDCASPQETGCPEGRYPRMTENIHENYPYLEIVSTPRRRHRRRPRRDVTDVTSQTGREIVHRHGECRGKEIDAFISDKRVIYPFYFHTLLCEGSCSSWKSHFLQALYPRCAPKITQKIRGLRLTDTGALVYGELPYTQVLQCGC